MSESPERTAEEREAARRERERRRGERRPDPPALGDGGDHDDHPDDEDDEVASGTRRISRLHRPVRKRPASGARRPQRHLARKYSLRGRIFSVVALLAAAAVVWFVVELFQPFHGSGHGSIVVTIPAHRSASQIGDLLERDGVVASSFFFELRAILSGQRGDLRSGTYHLKLDMSYGGVLKVLTTPPPAAKVTELTLIEGRTRHEIDALLRAEGINGSYLAGTRHSPLLKPTTYGAPRNTPSLEGFLFPSTYQLREPVSISALVADQLRTFRREFAKVNLRYARSKGLSPYDVLTIASMVEAEAATGRDRPLIASVIYNRLRVGMPLQIDATTRYATGNYSRPLTVSELDSRSPYNTRIHKGLPPTPIDNPGLASIKAAAHPARTNYLYFVVKPGSCEHAFASNYAQFLAQVHRYQTARSSHGGRSPARC